MSGRVDDALVQFKEAVKIKTDYAEAWVACGMALAQLGKPEEAKTYLEKARDLARGAGRNDLASQIEAMLASEHPWLKSYFRGKRGRLVHH